MTEKRRNKNISMVEWYEALIFALALLVLVFTFAVRVVAVNGSSMLPTLTGGDRILVQSAFFEAQRGDVIVVDGYIDYGKPLVKRVIALEGDVVEIDAEAGTVAVNGSVLEEPYIAEATHEGGDMAYPVTVPEGCVFAMGDNRMHSTDSRFEKIGFVDERDILGKVLMRIFPTSEMGRIR